MRRTELESHTNVAARWAVRLAFESWAEDGWQSHFPDVGELDFECIVSAAEKLLPADTTLAEFEATYAWFEKRAET